MLIKQTQSVSTLHHHCSKQIEFGLQTPQEIVKCGVFHVYERNLYKVRSLEFHALLYT